MPTIPCHFEQLSYCGCFGLTLWNMANNVKFIIGLGIQMVKLSGCEFIYLVWHESQSRLQHIDGGGFFVGFFT